MQHKLCCNTVYLRNMVCFRYIIVNSLHKGGGGGGGGGDDGDGGGDDDDDDDDDDGGYISAEQKLIK